MPINAYHRYRRIGIVLAAVSLCMSGGAWSEDSADSSSSAQDTIRLVVALETSTDSGGASPRQAGLIVGQNQQQLIVVTITPAAAAKGARAFLHDFPDQALPAQLITQSKDMAHLTVLGIDKPGDRRFDDLCLRYDRLGGEEKIGEFGSPVLPIGHVGDYRWILPPIADAIVSVDNDHIIFQSHIVSHGHLGGPLVNEAGHVIGLVDGASLPLATARPIGQVIEWLQTSGLPVDLRQSRFGFQHPLALAAEAWDLEEMRRLVQECHDVNSEDESGKTPLLHAVERGDVATATYLLDHGAQANTADRKCRIALTEAVDRNGTEMVMLLLNKGAAPSWKPNCVGAVRRAVFNANAVLLDMILAAFPEDGRSADFKRDLRRDFFVALGRGWEEGLRLFSQHGIPVDIRNEYSGKSALQEATQQGLVSSVVYLLKKGAPVSAADPQGTTALHTAAGGTADTHAAILDRLIAAGADLEAVDSNGETPLHKAFQQGEEVLVTRLLEACANPYAKNNDGEVPMAVASQDDLKKIFAHLVGTGAYDRQQRCPPEVRLRLPEE